MPDNSHFAEGLHFPIDQPGFKAETQAGLDRFLQCLNTDPAVQSWRFDFKDYQPSLALFDLSPSEFRAVVLYLLPCWQYLDELKDHHLSTFETRLCSWLILALRHKHCLDDGFLARITSMLPPLFSWDISRLSKSLVGRLEKFRQKPGFSQELQVEVTKWHQGYCALDARFETKSMREIVGRIGSLVTSSAEQESEPPFDDVAGEKSWQAAIQNGPQEVSWPVHIRLELKTMDHSQAVIWTKLWHHCGLSKATEPSRKWLQTAQELVQSLGDHFSGRAAGWLELIMAKTPRNTLAFSDNNAALIKGMLWASSLGRSDVLAKVIGDMVNWGYGKIPGLGPRALPVANAGLYALSHMGASGVVQLCRLRAAVKYDTGQRIIMKVLTEAAERLGISQADLEEVSVPAYDLDSQGSARMLFGDFQSLIQLKGTRHVEMQWFDTDGAARKGVPASVKKDYYDELQEWQKQCAELTDAVTAHAIRLESTYLHPRLWRYEDWRQRFIQHPLLGWLGGRLIWVFEDAGKTSHGLFLDGRLIDSAGNPLENLPDETRVRLWHPTDADVDEVHRWRALLQQREIIQPFRQAFREVYILTPAERDAVTSSARFAGHILKQFPLASLCRERGWAYQLQGDWDGYNEPTRKLPRSDIQVSLEIEYNEALNAEKGPTGVHLYIQIGHIRFNKPLAEIPPVVFSEIMRDADLFVGVCSIGVDPSLQARIDHPALGRFLKAAAEASLTDSALIRREILENILSKLVIAPRCRFEGKYLLVDGDLRGYKIHLGSGNILMTPNDQYLCIVPEVKKTAAATAGLFLPFEGDAMLDVILSKALLLAADKKIKDESILRQIQKA